MRKYFYFRDVADENDDDDILASVAIPVDSIAGIVPTSITTLEVYLRKKGVVNNQKVILTVTRGYLKEVMQHLADYAVGNSHVDKPLVVMADAAETTHGTSSVEGNDKKKASIFFSRYVTGVTLSGAGY